MGLCQNGINTFEELNGKINDAKQYFNWIRCYKRET